MDQTAQTQPVSIPPLPAAPVFAESQLPKKRSTQTLFLIITTLVVGTAIPFTVLIVKQGSDIRGRASEPTKTPAPLFPSVSPTPKLSACNQTCATHADCMPGFFCGETKTCLNALCPERIDCVCKEK